MRLDGKSNVMQGVSSPSSSPSRPLRTHRPQFTVHSKMLGANLTHDRLFIPRKISSKKRYSTLTQEGEMFQILSGSLVSYSEQSICKNMYNPYRCILRTELRISPSTWPVRRGIGTYLHPITGNVRESRRYHIAIRLFGCSEKIPFASLHNTTLSRSEEEQYGCDSYCDQEKYEITSLVMTCPFEAYLLPHSHKAI